ncbi:50S ribosomal protein L24 [Scatolibacter rhodanostii]|uniref:50S ribosomal protein L24 n=1 Tax=Scatolibacter rhodanostii TaxID=2014781 RepID=UPI000C06864D|nr:50S ribosomal protein L24 [Scatolibacter rhodanostii]
MNQDKKVHVKTGDTVMIMSGKDRGKKGKVLQVSPKEGKVIVENANFVSKHVKPKKMGEAGGIIKAESALYSCKVQIVCSHCGKPTRVGHKILNDGTKERICRKCGESL